MSSAGSRSGDAELRMISTEILQVGCEISGPPAGGPVILLHGWPDDVRTWDRSLASLHAAGRRTIVPYLRGFGPTRFLKGKMSRSGQISALGHDVLDLADALKLEGFAVIGHD
jgi:pimeloyl-ACP methyl ester carboxylesterase